MAVYESPVIPPLTITATQNDTAGAGNYTFVLENGH